MRPPYRSLPEASAAPTDAARRRFLIGGAALSGGLLVGCGTLDPRALAPGRSPVAGPDGALALNAWLRIAPSGGVVVAVPRAEMGQGVYTALPALVAEELDVEWAAVRAEQAPVDPVYVNVALVLDALPRDSGALLRWLAERGARALGLQVTGGSTSVRDAWEPMRGAGATARAMLVAAAARRWGVPEAQCHTEPGQVVHTGSDRRLAYGELVQAASRVRLRRVPPLKKPEAFRLLGRPLPRLDIEEKLDGSARFGIDVRLPGQRYAAIRHGPVLGSRLREYDAGAVEALPGVRAVVPLDDAVAVVADSWWQAQRALAKLPAEFTGGLDASLDSGQVHARLEQGLDQAEARTRADRGRVMQSLEGSAQRLSARYRVPYLPHLCMEPMNCTARVTGDACEVWVGNQAPSLVRSTASQLTGLPAERVQVHIPYLGGGFGRRAEMDVVREAVLLARTMPGQAVQLIWSRGEDVRHDYYRPAVACSLEAGLDDVGAPLAWRQRLCGPSVATAYMRRHFPSVPQLLPDPTDVEGALHMPYAVEAFRLEHVELDPGVPVGFWRSVGHSQNAFFIESFIDELAAHARRDPVEYRRALLAGEPRHLRVLEACTEAAGWGSPLSPGRGRGVALHASYGSVVGQVAELRMTAAGPVVERLVCAIDCGTVVNPDIVRAQMEGAMVFGLNAALQGGITLQGGAVVESNFHDCPLLGLGRTPTMEVLVLASADPPGGVGEPGVPPVAPAVANALFAATGERRRELPLAGRARS